MRWLGLEGRVEVLSFTGRFQLQPKPFDGVGDIFAEGQLRTEVGENDERYLYYRKQGDSGALWRI